MAQPYIGEIRMFAGNFPPVGWMFCSGALLPISENDALFVVLGTTYGGDGESTFALPNLQSRIPIHMGNGPDGVNYVQGEAAGVESVTLTTQQIPIHNHALTASTGPANDNLPGNHLTGASASVKIYAADVPTIAMNPASVGPQGGSQPHENCQPFLCINYIISLFGLFPSPT
jgi:microcystin-dependent protein